MDLRCAEALRFFIDLQRTREGVEVVEARLAEGFIALRRDGLLLRVHIGEAELLDLLSGAARDAEAAFGQQMSEEAAAARWLATWLDESLAWDSPHESGWWTYGDAKFLPEPPWEARQRRHRQG